MMSVRIGPYVIHLDALLARLVFLWRPYALVAIIIVVIAILWRPIVHFVVDIFTPNGDLTVIADGAVRVEVDRRPWDGHVKVGMRRVAAFWERSVAWRDVEITSGVPTTVTLTPGWEDVHVRRVALPQNAVIEFVTIRHDGNVTAVVWDDIDDPSSLRRQYAFAGDRVSVVPSADAYAGWHDRSPDGRTSVVAAARGKETALVMLSVENQEGSFRASYEATGLLFVVVEPIRQGALIFEYAPTANRTRITWLTYRGRTVFIGAVSGRPTLLRWSASGNAAVIVTKPSLRAEEASLFVIDMASARLPLSETEALPVLATGDTNIPVPATTLTPAFTITGDRVSWIRTDGNTSSLRTMTLSDFLVGEETSAPCPARAFWRSDKETIWLCRMNDAWQIWSMARDEAHWTGVAIFALPIREVTGSDMQPSRQSWLGFSTDGVMHVSWRIP